MDYLIQSKFFAVACIFAVFTILSFQRMNHVEHESSTSGSKDVEAFYHHSSAQLENESDSQMISESQSVPDGNFSDVENRTSNGF